MKYVPPGTVKKKKTFDQTYTKYTNIYNINLLLLSLSKEFESYIYLVM
jgi:hypothetical protein